MWSWRMWERLRESCRKTRSREERASQSRKSAWTPSRHRDDFRRVCWAQRSWRSTCVRALVFECWCSRMFERVFEWYSMSEWCGVFEWYSMSEWCVFEWYSMSEWYNRDSRASRSNSCARTQRTQQIQPSSKDSYEWSHAENPHHPLWTKTDRCDHLCPRSYRNTRSKDDARISVPVFEREAAS